MYKRIIAPTLASLASKFIFGPRMTGKTTLVKNIPIQPNLSYNLLINSEFLRLNSNPDILYKEVKDLVVKTAKPTSLLIWIDEIQKIPELLDVVHHCIEEFSSAHFILTGSSARKLKRAGVNLLGGRALDVKIYPLSIEELGEDFDLMNCLLYGSLPKIATLIKGNQLSLALDLLDSYVSTYISEEIKNEALVRDLAAFQRFLEVAASAHSEIINFQKIADDCQISHTACTNYFSILEDTLIGFFIHTYHTSIRKQLTKQPKFYFFDNGVTRAILKMSRSVASNIDRGKLFEQFVIQELIKVNQYYKRGLDFYLWRTSTGSEVDFVVTKNRELVLAIECKSNKNISKRDLSGLKSFKEEYPKVTTLICAPIDNSIEIEEGFRAVNIKELIEIVDVI